MAIGKLVDDATRQLNDWLSAAKFKEGDALPSERAISRELGIKYYALNRAMSRLIAEGRVERQGYRLSLVVKARPAKRAVFHLVVSYWTHHLASYRRAAENLEIDLVVHQWKAVGEAASLLEQLDLTDTAGVICDPPTEYGDTAWVRAALQLTGHGIPVVCTGAWDLSNEFSSVAGSVMHGLELGFSHLRGQGHRELALVTLPHIAECGLGAGDYWRRLCAGNHADASGERILFQSSELTAPGEIDVLAELLADGPWKNVTGLVLLIGHRCTLQSVIKKLVRRGRRIPESLSLVVVGDARTLHAARPRVTAATFDMVLWFETAFDLLRREVRAQLQFGVQRRPSGIRVMPCLTVRDSTRALGEGVQARPVAASDAEPLLVKGAAGMAKSGPRKKGAGLEHLAKLAYSLAAKASLSESPRFMPVDLRSHVNRSLLFRRGWLGDISLRCLAPGTQEIHGVPFEILGGPNRADGGAIIFQSAINTIGNAQKLPDRMIIPIAAPVEAVYILHGCGYAKPLQAFAEYGFYAADGVVGTVPLVSLGRSSEGRGINEVPGPDADNPNANIQDWWPDFPHMDFPHARMVPLLETDETSHANRHVFLYTLEWINPSPKKLLTHLEIRVDPSVPTTLGVLAITVVKPRGGVKR
ncbi:MAG: GntR family transcriptional regulator [Opitutaceae bacterium]|jgi:DNA-binding LacI/PurR family transcriptional regulator